MRLGKEKELEKEKQIESGFLVCKNCNTLKPLYYFSRLRKDDKIYYRNNKCKLCITGREPKLNKIVLEGEIRPPKTFTIKKNTKLSPEAKDFVKRVIYMKGYIDQVEAFKLVHYHIETFDYVERLILDTELELTTMFRELLEVYNRDKKENNI
jgi:hypothetical protein